MDNTTTYRASDRNLLAWLHYRGHKHVRSELINGKQVYLHYEETDDLQKDILIYKREEDITMCPFALLQHLKIITDIIFQTKDAHV